jgi:hypothetical protein
MYIWRVPVDWAIAVGFGILAVVLVAPTIRFRAGRSLLTRAVADVSVLIVLFASTWAPDVLLRWWLRSLPGLYVDPGDVVTLFPPVFAVLLLSVAAILFPASCAHSDAWRIGYGLAVVAFVVLNLTNRCVPGWCGQFGLPFTWFEFSDAIGSFNGEPQNPFRFGAFAADVAFLVSASTAAAVTYRKRHSVAAEKS